jgi:hypothetical protein
VRYGDMSRFPTVSSEIRRFVVNVLGWRVAGLLSSAAAVLSDCGWALRVLWMMVGRESLSLELGALASLT